jgi:hypothetical protein
MKSIFLIPFFFINFTFFSQGKKIIIVDSLTKNHIEYANIKYLNSKKGTFSNNFGVFDINIKKSEKILISVLGYKNKILITQKIKDTIFLKPKSIILDEISIKINSKKNYGYHLRKSKFLGSSVKRSVIAVYIENKKTDLESIISSLHFKIKKRGNSISFIRPHLYTINTKTKLPEKELLEYNLLIKEKKKRKGLLTINIREKNIVFPKEGVFLALEWVGNTDDIDFGYNEVKKKLVIPTLLTSLNFNKRIWVPVVFPKSNKNFYANFGITTMESKN